MNNYLFKYPSTAHLSLLGDTQVRGDKVMSESERNDFLQHEIIIEEKIDGANLGISFDNEGNIRAQNRGSYLDLPGVGQWKKLNDWLSSKAESLLDHLFDQYILFGEWCYAKHSIAYDRLPDWFLGFDIYDRNAAQFFSCTRRNELFDAIGIEKTPYIDNGRFTIQQLTALLAQSKLGDQPSEGLYLRYDQGDWLNQRAKLVRHNFVQSIEDHWSHGGITPNKLLGMN